MGDAHDDATIPLPSFHQISTNYRKIKETIPPNVTFLAVTKRRPPSLIECLYEAGHREFGESTPQELFKKASILNPKLPDCRWHFIGRLQSNKIGLLLSVTNLVCVHGLESIKHAAEIERRLVEINSNSGDGGQKRILDVYCQVNVSGEKSKGGIPLTTAAPSATDNNALRSLIDHVRNKCPHLNLKGLMMIGSYEASTGSTAINPEFSKLAEIAQEHGLSGLSMGMSADYQQAIKQGSTCVRIGGLLFA